MFFEAVVIGGGINGLGTARALVKRGVKEVALVEQFEVGGKHGGSHGDARITRSAYSDAAYVKLMQRVHAEEWPALETDLGRQLVFPAAGCFFGRGERWKKYLAAVMELPHEEGGGVELLDPDAAAKRFPMFRFEGIEEALCDHTAGALAAGRTVSGLKAWLADHGVMIRENTAMESFDRGGATLKLKTSAGTIETKRAAITAGAWLGKLVPAMAPALSVLRQTVAYVRYDVPPEAQRLGSFPTWCFIDEATNDFFYGLPEFETPGAKLGRHRTAGENDPLVAAGPPSKEAVADLSEFLDERMTWKVAEILAAEHCLYAATPDEDFRIGLLPGDPRIAIGSACSGHGFKFGPWTGRAIAELLLDGESKALAEAELTERFAISGGSAPGAVPRGG
ncbi:MAG TPA: FAD-dependent oxidoreductase [Planctomycetia bacterium]|nr:FAD-dependent oxidoreductase [Planctomycetia bacterium]